jgi:hypothetical protein
MKILLTVFVLLLLSLSLCAQTSPPTAPTPPSTRSQPLIESGGLDDRCQSGLVGSYNVHEDGSPNANNAEESTHLSDASTCIGYIAGWSHTLSGAFIMQSGSLWYVEISDQLSVTKIALGLHKFLVDNPDAREVSSPLVLLKIAIDEDVAKVTKVQVRQAPQDNNDDDAPTPPPTSKS